LPPWPMALLPIRLHTVAAPTALPPGPVSTGKYW